MEVDDDGVGLPAGFAIEASSGLGLSIVRTLVTSELERHDRMLPAEEGPGTVVRITVPIETRAT